MTAPWTRTSVVAIVWMIACVRTAGAQPLWEPPSIGDGRQFPVIAVPSDLIPALGIDKREIVLDRTPLADAAQWFKARIGRRGAGSESLGWVCIAGRDAEGRWMLWLQSGEIHGNAVGAFHLRRIGAAERIDAKCVSSRAGVRNAAGLRLGMSRADVRRMLGDSSGTPPMVAYLYEHPGAGGVTIESMISVVFANDAVTAFEVWRTETN